MMDTYTEILTYTVYATMVLGPVVALIVWWQYRRYLKTVPKNITAKRMWVEVANTYNSGAVIYLKNKGARLPNSITIKKGDNSIMLTVSGYQHVIRALSKHDNVVIV